MLHIFERHGVLIQCDYERAVDGSPLFSSARVLGQDYRPVGPNLMDLLDKTLLFEDPQPQADAVVEAERFFSAVAEELPA